VADCKGRVLEYVNYWIPEAWVVFGKLAFSYQSSQVLMHYPTKRLSLIDYRTAARADERHDGTPTIRSQGESSLSDQLSSGSQDDVCIINAENLLTCIKEGFLFSKNESR
jgi:hypothetical protein